MASQAPSTGRPAAPSARPGAADGTRLFSREEVDAAFGRAVDETEGIAGEDWAIDLISLSGDGLPEGSGPFTLDEAAAAWNVVAEEAKEEYNPDDGETSDTVRSDTCGDLIVNLAVGFLRSPGADVDDVIADQWADLEPDDPEELVAWNQHGNQLGDYCPWSGTQATPANREALFSGLDDDDDLCPQACPGSWTEELPKDSDIYRAAIAATVRGWVS